MAQDTYTTAVNRVSPTQVPQPTIQPRATGAFDQITQQIDAQKLNTIEGINEGIQVIAKNELKDRAERIGLENAQSDFAEISRLENFKTELRGQVTPETSIDERVRLNTRLVTTDTQIKELLKKQSNINISEQVRANNINEIYLHKVDVDSQHTIAQAYEKNKYNPEAFEKDASKLLDNLGAVPDKYRETVKYNIKNHISATKDKATVNAKKQHYDEITAVRNDKLGLETNIATQLALAGKPITESLLKVQNIIDAQVKDETITNVQAENYMSKFKTDIDTQKAFGGYDTIHNSGRTDSQKIADTLTYAESFKASLQPNMDAATKTQIYLSIRAKNKAFETQIKAGREEYDKVAGSFLTKVTKRLLAGETVGDTDINQAKIYATKLDKVQDLNIALVGIENIKRLNSISPTAQPIYLEKLKEHAAELDSKGESTLGVYQVIDVLEKSMNKNQDAIKKDPIGYAINNPQDFGKGAYSPTNITKMDGAVQYNQDGSLNFNNYSDVVTTELANRFDNKDHFIATVGNYKSLAPEEVNLLNRRFNGMDKDNKAVFQKHLVDKIGYNEAGKIFGEMWEKDASSSLMAAQIYTRGGADNVDISNNILRGREIAKEKLGKMDSDTKQQFNEDITRRVVLAGKAIDPANLKVITDTISDAYFGMTSDPDNVDNKDILKKATDAVTNGVVEYKGRNIFAPEKGYSEDDVEDWIIQLGSKEDTTLETNYKLPDGYRDWDQFKADLDAEKFYLESTGVGKYRLKGDNNNIVMSEGKAFNLDWFSDNPNNERKPKVGFFKGLFE